MGVKQIQEYLRILLDIQKEQFMQVQLMNRLVIIRDSLGIPRNYTPPKRGMARGSYKDIMLPASAICSIFFAVISCFVNINKIKNGGDGLGDIIKDVFIYALIGFIIGLVVGFFIAIISQISRQSDNDREYKQSILNYNQKIAQDQQRVNYELQVQQRIVYEINLLKEQMKRTSDFENRLTNLGILDRFYHHDIVATASFYQYFNSKRTFSLGFNPNTGDQGAYNIYEQEKRMNLIIDKLDVVIKKLDQIERNQTILFMCLSEANQKLDRLNSNILNATANIQKSINNQTEMQRYSNECIRSEIEYSNTLQMLNIVHNW